MATNFLPNANFNTSVTGSGVTPISTINERANTPRDLTATVAAQGALVPILYGERDVPGLVFAQGKIGTDLVVGYLWCVGEVQAIDAIYINDAAPVAGITVTHYTGTSTQTADATLSSAIAGYNDRMRIPLPGGAFLGLAYSVVRITTAAAITGFPRARAVIRGRKLYDPRTLTTAYSDNPALALYDLVTNTAFGLGRVCLGADDVADWCDELLGGVSGAFRARIGLYIAQGRKAEEYIDLLCEYAECFQVYEGAAIKLIPDAPVDLETVPIVGPESIIQNSLSLEAESSSDTPTEVEFQYTEEPTTASQPWSLVSTIVQMPGVDEGEVQRIPTSITLEGVTRQIEAGNKALARLYKLQNRITARWQTVDKGVVNQRGDVVQLTHTPRGIDMPVRIMDVSLVAPGRYQVAATRYDPSHYPSDIVLPEDEGVVPVGAIGMLIGSTVPDGWELFNDANDKYIVGAGSTYAVGASGVSTAGPWAGSITGGEHGSPADDIPYPRAGTTTVPAYSKAGAFAGTGGHTHTWSLASITENILRRENILVRKTGIDGLKIPSSVRVFGLQNVVTEATKNTGFVGRLLMPKTASANAGVSTQASSAATFGNADDTHTHHPNLETKADPFGGVGISAKSNNSAGGTHTHTCNLTPAFNVKRRTLCCFEGAAEYSPRPGMIWMWSGSIGSIPADHVLCNGSSGTPDMRDYFVEFGADTSGTASGNNTMTLSGTSNQVGHSHQGADLPLPSDGGGYGHAVTVFHDHTISSNHAYIPKYYALAFIMYAPGA